MLKRTFACLLMAILLLCNLPCGAGAASPASPQALQGAWVCSEGQNTMILMFNGNDCAMTLNGMQMAGTWNLAGSQLRVQFQNGRTKSWQCAMEGGDLVLDGGMRFRRQAMPGQQGQPNYGGQPAPGPQGYGGQASPLEGTWAAQTPQGQLVFQFQGSRYAQYFNGQAIEEGFFTLLPDGRLQYQVTAGQAAGQQGENRIAFNGQSFTMYSAGGSMTFTRQGQPQQPQDWGRQPAPSAGATPIEGRWVWAKRGPVSFGYVFSGNRFTYFMNGAQAATGTFQLTGYQLILQYETGSEAGKTVSFAYRLTGGRLVVFPSDDPNIDPIPFVRQ